jgi:putative ATP-dependent endonuclease of OLD family
MGKVYTKLDGDDYLFLEKFLDVTKSNLFFAKGVILVEGWAEEIFLPSFAKILKRQGIIDKDLTEAGISIVNIGNTAFLRYSKIFLRAKLGEVMNVPVSIITDVDVREYQKKAQIDDDGNVVKDENGKVVYSYVERDNATITQEKQEKITSLNTSYDENNVKSFVASDWTLEYCLHKSISFGEKFKSIVRGIHTQMDIDNFELELAKKLINKGLKKTEIAYQIAKEFEEDLKRSAEESQITINVDGDAAISYLINAIKHVYGN